jgi:hypothetical protein
MCDHGRMDINLQAPVVLWALAGLKHSAAMVKEGINRNEVRGLLNPCTWWACGSWLHRSWWTRRARATLSNCEIAKCVIPVLKALSL